MNVLDGVSQSYSHEGNPKLDQIRYPTETWDHEYVDSKVIKLFSKFYAFYEEEGHVIMDCPFVPFHIKTSIVKHVELQNVVKITRTRIRNSCSPKQIETHGVGKLIRTTPKCHFSWDSQVGTPKIPKIENPTTLDTHNFLCKLSIEARFEAKL